MRAANFLLVKNQLFYVFLFQIIPKKETLAIIMLIEISDAVLNQAPAYTNPEDVKADFAVWLYERGRLTLAQAARFCDRTRLQFQKILKDRGVHLNYSTDDLQIDLQNM